MRISGFIPARYGEAYNYGGTYGLWLTIYVVLNRFYLEFLDKKEESKVLLITN